MNKSQKQQDKNKVEVGVELKLEDLKLVTGGLPRNHTTYCKDPVAGVYECDSID